MRTSYSSIENGDSKGPASQDGSQKASFDEPSKFRKLASLGNAMKAGDGSFRGLFPRPSISKEKSTNYNPGPSLREVPPQEYLRDEIVAARDAVNHLDAAVSGAHSFREKATKLLEEAHRALGRLEQAVAYRDGAPELIVIACEIKCAARRGVTLVDVYGKYNSMIKMMTLFMRSFIYAKFDKQIELLKKLIPPAEVARPMPCGTSAYGQAAENAACAAAAGALAPASQPPMVLTGSLARSSLSHQPSPPQPVPGPIVGIMLRPNKHDRVHAMAYVPSAQAGRDQHVCIWWSAGLMLEFYSEATQATTGFQIEKASQNVTALGIDEDGNVWTGHTKGLVRVRPKQAWEYTAEDKAFSSAIKAITFDGAGRAWIGDEAGRIKVIAYSPQAGGLVTVASLVRSPQLLAKMKGALAETTRGLFGKRSCGTGAFASGGGAPPAVAASPSLASPTAASGPADAIPPVPQISTVTSSSSSNLAREGSQPVTPLAPTSGHNQPVAVEGPVRCIFLCGGKAWTSGGRSTAGGHGGWLQMWDATTFQDLDVFDCCSFGPCHAMAALRWPSGPASSTTHLHNYYGQHRSSTAAAVTRSVPQSPSVSDVGVGAPAAGMHSSSWRLLTGHENGQLLLWHPDSKTLAPLLRIGEPHSPCRGIALLDKHNLVATGHMNGELRLFSQPTTESGLPPGAESATPQSFGTVRPRMVIVQAHKSRVDRMAHNGTSVVTSSFLGTIRLWHAADLAAEAQRQGLLTHTLSYSSMGNLGAGGAAGPMSAGGYIHREGSAAGESIYASGGGAMPPISASSAMTLHGQPQSRHGRQPSRDAVDGAGGTLTQHSSGSTAATDLGAPGASVPLPGPSAAQAGFPHFQTIDAAELSMKKLIGSGAYGKVSLAEWTGCQVAVKELFGLGGGRGSLSGTPDEREYTALMNEVTLLGSLSHPNIMRFLAMCLEPPLIVMQYYPHGSLFDLLSRAQRGSARAVKELAWGKRLDMLRDVAAGMHYLHTRKPPVIHGDLRSPNLLLDLTIDHERPRFHVKIADFGLARMLTGAGGAGSVMVSRTTNPRWLAPEVIKNGSVGKAADVYSFGIIMWELLTWQQPYEDMMSVQVMFSTVTEGSRPEVPPEAQLPGSPGVSLHLYRQLMERCWAADTESRPGFKEVVDYLQAMQQVEADNARQQQQQQRQLGGAVGSTPAGGARPRVHSEADTGTPGSAVAGDAGSEFSAGQGQRSAGQLAGGAGPGSSAAATAAATRRAGVPGVPGVPSPFAQAPAPDDDASALLQAMQHGSLRPMYGMSPILEEQLSHSSGGVVGAAAAAGLPARFQAPGLPSATFQASNHQQPQLHVHFAAGSPFAPVAAEAPPRPSSPVPSSPSASASRPRTARPSLLPASSSSSTEGAALSAQAHAGGMGGTGPSSRHSSGSASGAPSNRLGGPAGPSPGGSAASVVRRAGAPGTAGPGPTRTGSAAGIPRHGYSASGSPAAGGSGGGVGGGLPTATAARAAARARRNSSGTGGVTSPPATSPNGDLPGGATGRHGAMPAWEACTPPVGAAVRGVSALSPFAAAPSDQLGAAGAAPGSRSPYTPPHSGGVHEAHAGPTPGSDISETLPRDHVHGQPGAPPQPIPASSRISSRPTSAGTVGSYVNTHSGGMKRMPGPTFGPPASRQVNSVSVGSGVRGAAAAPHTAPSTPPYRGNVGSRGVPGTASSALDGRSSECRHGPAAGATSRPAGRTQSGGDEPPGTGCPTSGIVSRTNSVSSTTSAHRAPACEPHFTEGGAPAYARGRAASQSAAHAHVTGPGPSSARPGHLRTPSGGSVCSGGGAPPLSSGPRPAGPSGAAAQAQPRTPTAGAGAGRSRTTGRVSAPNAGDPRIIRRHPSNLGPAAVLAAGATGVHSPGLASRLSASARPPASPRVAGQHAAASAVGSGGADAGNGTPRHGSSLSFSRIPSLVRGVAPGGGSVLAGVTQSLPMPVKTASSLSLDAGCLRRLGLNNAVSSSPPVASSFGSPSVTVIAGAAANNPFAAAAWDGVAVELSNGPTGDVDGASSRQASRDFGHMEHEALLGEMSYESVSATNNIPGGRSGSVAAASAASFRAQAWQPPPLLTAGVVSGAGSPFAAAAGRYQSPFGAAPRSEEGDMDAERGGSGETDEQGLMEARTSPSGPYAGGALLALDRSLEQETEQRRGPDDGGVADVIEAAAPPKAPAGNASPFAAAAQEPLGAASSGQVSTWWADQRHQN